jgi:hypothetical protein
MNLKQYLIISFLFLNILFNNILELVKNESLQILYSKKGLNRSNFFTLEKNCTQTINIYNQLIS